MFIKNVNLHIIIAQIYVDDIIFGSTSELEVKIFVDQMKSEFEMSMVGELTFFSRSTGKENGGRHFCEPKQICKELGQKIWP